MMTNKLTIEDVLKQLRKQKRQPVILYKGEQELMNISLYKEQIAKQMTLLYKSKINLKDGNNDVAILYVDEVYKWLNELYKRANGDLTNYLNYEQNI